MVKVEYPHDTWVLDEGDDPEVKALCARIGVNHFSRKGIERYNQKSGSFTAKTKGGNQNAWRDSHEWRYDFVAQMDVDHVPHPDYLHRTLGYFRDPDVGFVLGPQIYGNQHESWIARGSAEQAFGFFGVMQRGYNGAGMALLIGTNHVYRVTAMRDIGGYASSIVEDHLTGMHFFVNGWRGIYIPEVLSVGEGPVNWTDYLNQQLRWSYGLFEIIFKHSWRLIPKMPLKKAVHYVFAQSYYFTGLAAMLSVGMLWLYFFLGISPVEGMRLGDWFEHAFPVFLLTNLIYFWSQRFNVNPETESGLDWRGFLLNMGAIPIYFLALIMATLRRPLTYAVTAKGAAARAGQGVVVRPFLAHYVILAITLEAMLIGLSLGRSAWHLYAWAMFIIVAFGSAALTGLFGLEAQALPEDASASVHTASTRPVLAPLFPVLEAGFVTATVRGEALSGQLVVVIGEANARLGAERGSLMVLDPETNTYDMAASRQLPEPVATAGSVRAGEGLVGWVAQTRQPLIIDGRQLPAGVGRHLTQPELCSSIVLPVQHDGATVAVLSVSSKQVKLGDESLRWLQERVGTALTPQAA